MTKDRFHWRFASAGRGCGWPECDEAGEFRAPGGRPPGFDGPGDFRWFCLEHIRLFNAGYDYFEGMTSEEIFQAQSPLHGYASTSRAFRPDAGIDDVPRWADFADPLEAINMRAKSHAQAKHEQMHSHGGHADSGIFTSAEMRALGALGLGQGTDRASLRRRYTELVRRYHPDHNGGDRSHEGRLQQVVDAYQTLRKAPVFS